MTRRTLGFRVSLIVALSVAVCTSVSAQSSTEPAVHPTEGWRYEPAAGLVYERGDFKWITWGFAERLFNPTGRATWRRVRQGMEFDLPRFTEKYRNAFVYEVDLTNNDFFRVGQRRRILENLFLTIQDADDASAFRVLLGENTHILSREDNQSSGNLPTINRSLILEEHGSVNAFGTQFGVQVQKVLSPRYTLALSAQDNRGSFNQDRPHFVIGNSLAAKVTTLAVRDDARGRRLTFGAAIDHTRDIRDRTFTLSSAIAQDVLGGTSASGNKLTLEGDATYTGRVGTLPFTLEGEGLRSTFSQSRTQVVGGYAQAQVCILSSEQTGTIDLFARYDMVRLSRQGIDGRASQQATRMGLNYNLPYARQLANFHIEFADNQISGPAAMVRTPRSFDEVRFELRFNLTQYARR